ncbi:MAG: DUF2628 domain-containing protein [Rhodospirillales bacterium]|jgi:hypothetical protein
MRIYTVHIKRAGAGELKDPDRGLILIKEGFSWPAFLLTGLWALWHRMWLWAVVIIAANATLSLTVRALTSDTLIQGAISVGFALIIGFIGNDLHRRSLAYKNYREFGVVAADNVSAAEGRFFDNNPHWVSAFRS